MLKKRTQTRVKPRGRVPDRSSSTSYADIVSKIQDVGDMETFLKILWYGRSGTGKTTSAGHILPKPLLIIDLKENGTDSIIDVKGAKVSKCSSWDDFEQLYWYLESGDHPYKSVLLDTVTGLQELSHKHVMEEEGKEFMSLQLRGKSSELMKTWLLNYRDLPIHVGFTAQDRTDEVETEEEDQIMPQVGPAVSPGIAKSLNAMVKLIFNTYIQEVISRAGGQISRRMEYRIRTGPHQYYLTKIRKPKNKSVPDFVVDPTFEDVLALMKGEYKSPSDRKRPIGAKPKTPLRKRR